ncbi:unnamed protein product [Moneuplotes crassus]|uniref:Uncharacterized protein n=1 Tax=Euplotes crassus TaxID=5936 RepID=A0AAD2D7X5_EUPCR|nr:unnamed protein product [Moneuplotes crassus]
MTMPFACSIDLSLFGVGCASKENHILRNSFPWKSRRNRVEVKRPPYSNISCGTPNRSQ